MRAGPGEHGGWDSPGSPHSAPQRTCRERAPQGSEGLWGLREGTPPPLTPPPRFPWLWASMSWLLPQPRAARAPGGQSPGWAGSLVHGAAWQGRAGLRAGGKLQSSLSRPSPTHPTRQTPGSNLPPPLWPRVPRLVLGTAPGSFRAEGGACPHLSRPVPGCSSWPLRRAGHPLREALQAPPGLPGPQGYGPQRFWRHRAFSQRLPDRQTHGRSVSQAP